MNRNEAAEIADLVRWLDEHPTNFTQSWQTTIAVCPICGDSTTANVEDVITLGIPCVLCGERLIAARYRVSRTDRRNRGIYAYSHGRGPATANVFRGDIVEHDGHEPAAFSAIVLRKGYPIVAHDG